MAKKTSVPHPAPPSLLQTKDTPLEDDPLRRFYTSLLEQRPDSDMARRWCAQFGLLPREEAERWVLEQASKKGKGTSPAKPTAAKKRAASSGAKVAAKRSKAAGGKVKATEASEDEWSEGSEDEVLPTKKRRVGGGSSGGKKAAAAAGSSSDSDDAFKAPPPKPKPKSKPKAEPKPSVTQPRSQRDVAFVDGGLDGSSSDEDDMPLSRLALKVAAKPQVA